MISCKGLESWRGGAELKFVYRQREPVCGALGAPRNCWAPKDNRREGFSALVRQLPMANASDLAVYHQIPKYKRLISKVLATPTDGKETSGWSEALAAERSPPSHYKIAAKWNKKWVSLKWSCVEYIFLAQTKLRKLRNDGFKNRKLFRFF